MSLQKENGELEVTDSLNVAAQYYREGKFQAAFQQYLAAAQQGDVHAQEWVGWMFSTGRGVERNVAEAKSWYKKAASQGNLTALWRLARTYRDGEGVDSDKRRAFSLFEKASQMGHVFARRDMAVLLIQGHHGAGGILKGLSLLLKSVTDLIKIGWKSENDERLRH